MFNYFNLLVAEFASVMFIIDLVHRDYPTMPLRPIRINCGAFALVLHTIKTLRLF